MRICIKNAIIQIKVPHATSYANWSDLQHVNNFTENSFDKWRLKEYGLEELELINKKFVFKNKWKKFIPFKKYLKIFFIGLYDDIKFEFKINK